MRKLIDKIRMKLIRLLGGERLLPNKQPIKVIEYRPKIRTIVSSKAVKNEYRSFIPIDRILNDLALDIGQQIIKTVDFQTGTEYRFDEEITFYRVKVDIIEKMNEKEVSE